MADANALDRGVGVPLPGEPGRPNPGSPGGPPAVPIDAQRMSLLDHLNELRIAIFKSILAVFIASTVGLFLATPVRTFLHDQLPGPARSW